VRPSLDLIVLPGNHEPTRQNWELMASLLGLGDDQVIWTSGASACMDLDMTADVVAQLGARFEEASEEERWLLVPYDAKGETFLAWATPLLDGERVGTFAEATPWLERFGDKGILHREAAFPERLSVMEQLGIDAAVPRGFNAGSAAELAAAHTLLGAPRDCAIKPLGGATGAGIELRPSREQLQRYGFPMGLVALEEFLDIDYGFDGIETSPALHYVGRKTFLMLDQLMDGTAYVGWRVSKASAQFEAECRRVLESLLDGMAPQACGGIDFVSVRGKPVLLDINTGRFNGAHFALLFKEMHAPHATDLYCWKMKLPSQGPREASELLEQAGIAYDLKSGDPLRSGVFPLYVLPGCKAQFVAFGTYPGQATELARIAHIAMGVEPPPSTVYPASPPLPAGAESSSSTGSSSLDDEPLEALSLDSPSAVDDRSF
jgi:hypothetical protein